MDFSLPHPRRRAAFFARCLRPLINGDGAHDIPPGPLTPYHSREKRRVAGLNVTIRRCPIQRVAIGYWALPQIGAHVTFAGLPSFRARSTNGCRVTYNVEEAIREADVINLLRIQHERQRKTMFPGINEYTTLFGLNQTRLAMTKPDALIMHPGPINRGVEIDSDIADSGRSVILEQVTNGLAVA